MNVTKKAVLYALAFVFLCGAVHATDLVPGLPEQFKGSGLEQTEYRRIQANKEAEERKQQQQTQASEERALKKAADDAWALAVDSKKNADKAKTELDNAIMESAKELGLTQGGKVSEAELEALKEQLMDTEYAQAITGKEGAYTAANDAYEKLKETAKKADDVYAEYHKKRLAEQHRLNSTFADLANINTRLLRLEQEVAAFSQGMDVGKNQAVLNLELELLLRDIQSVNPNDLEQYKEKIEAAQFSTLGMDEETIKRLTDIDKALHGGQPKHTIGDPVFITNGRYYLDDTDTAFRWGTNVYSVTRTYVSGTDVQGSFGLGWYTSLDARIVRGQLAPDEALYFALADMKKQNLALRANLDGIEILEAEASLANSMITRYDALLGEYLGVMEQSLVAAQTGRNTNMYAPSDLMPLAARLGTNCLLYRNEAGHVQVFAFCAEKNRYEPLGDSATGDIYIEEMHAPQKGFVVRERDGMQRAFNENGCPLYAQDRFGVRIDFEADRSQRVQAVRHNGAAMLTVGRNADGTVRQIHNHVANQTVRYQYASGRLAGVTLANGATTAFTYDGADLVRVQKTDGSTVHIAYGSSSGASGKTVIRTTNEEGFDERFYMSADGTAMTYVDADGLATEYALKGGRVIREQKPDGTATEYDYDAHDRLCATRTDFGVMRYAYDASGNITEISHSDGTSERLSYEPRFGMIQSYTNRDGVTTRYEYDASGFCTGITCAGKTVYRASPNGWGGAASVTVCGQTEEYAYDKNYNVIQRGQVQYEYDDCGALKTVTSATGEQWHYRYGELFDYIENPNGTSIRIERDKRGDTVQTVSEDMVTGLVHVDRYAYDKRHLVVEHSRGTGYGIQAALSSMQVLQSIAYTPGGRVQRIIRWNYGAAAENDAPGICEAFSYGRSGHAESRQTFFVDRGGTQIGPAYTVQYDEHVAGGKTCVDTTCNGISTGSFYLDANGNVTRTVDAAGRAVEYAYSAGGRLLGMTLMTGGTYQFEYDDASGQVSRVRNDKGVVMEQFFDEFGRPVKVIGATGQVTEYDYSQLDGIRAMQARTGQSAETFQTDAYGNILSHVVLDADGGIVQEKRFSFDFKNRTVRLSNGTETRGMEYDAWNRLVHAERDGRAFTYDADGLIVSESQSCADGTMVSVHYEYNADKNVSRITKSDGRRMDYFYDARSCLVRIQDDAGVVWSAAYDAMGRLARSCGRLSPQRAYEYDGSGNITAVWQEGVQIASARYSRDLRTVSVDCGGNSVVSFFDEYGTLTKEMFADGTSRAWTHNQFSESSSFTDRLGRRFSVKTDRRNRSLTVQAEGGVAKTVRFDAAGAITQAACGDENITFAYDAGHRLTRVQTECSSVQYEWDAAGRRVGVTVDGATTRYEYDALGRMTKVSLDGEYRVFEYGAESDWIFCADSNGMTTERSFDGAGRLLHVVQKSGGKTVYAESTMRDDDGRITLSVSFEDGRVSARQFGYDAQGRLCRMSMTHSEALEQSVREEAADYGAYCPATWDYEALTFSPQETFFLAEFSARAGVVLPRSHRAWTERYEWDESGNRVFRGTPIAQFSYDYDAQNRLVSSVAKGGAAASYEYDAAGSLVAKKKLYRLETFGYNEYCQLEKVCVSDLRNSKSQEISYRYDAFGRVSRIQHDDGTIIACTYDGLSFAKLKEAVLEGGSVSAAQPRYRKVGDDGMDVQAGGSGLRLYALAGGDVAFCVGSDSSGGRTVTHFAHDLRGSVRSVGFADGTVLAISYDADGLPLAQEPEQVPGLPAYCGKQFEPCAGLYNYGYRFYSPGMARFVTEDPARDGANWYAYAGCDPVNFVDVQGLRNNPPDVLRTMSSYGVRGDTRVEGEYYINEQGQKVGLPFGELLGYSTDEHFYLQGCLVTFVSGMLNTLYRIRNEKRNLIFPHTINDGPEELKRKPFLSDAPGDLSSSDIENGFNVKVQEWRDASVCDMGMLIDAYNACNTDFVLTARVFYKEGSTSKHFVGVSGGVQVIDGKRYFQLVGTSDLDTKVSKENPNVLESRKSSWIIYAGHVWVPIEEVAEVRAWSNPNPKAK